MIFFAEASRDEDLSRTRSVSIDVVDSLVVKRLAQIRPDER